MFLSRFFSAFFFDASFWGKAGALIVPHELVATFAIVQRFAANADSAPRLIATTDNAVRLSATPDITTL